jgi:hypothetical protein
MVEQSTIATIAVLFAILTRRMTSFSHSSRITLDFFSAQERCGQDHQQCDATEASDWGFGGWYVHEH